MTDRRMATPHKTRIHPSHYRRSEQKDHLTAIVTIAFLVGILLGATIDRGWLALTGG